MHGIARLLSFVLTNLRNVIRKRKFAKFLDCFKDLLFFQGQGSAETISAFKAKQFLESDETLLEVSMFWRSAEIHSPIQLAKGLLVSFSSEKTVLLLFRACQTFTALAYQPEPTKQDFEALDIARQVLLATFKVNSWKMVNILHVFAKEPADCLSSLPPQPFSRVP